MLRIAVCAPSTPFDRADAARVAALAAGYPGVDLVFHEQCFAQEGHFAGPDALRLSAFVDCANDPAFDAVWFARGGYGAARIAQDAVGLLGAAAGAKRYLGYSDGGVLLAALYRAGIGRPVHAPMPVDLRREGGEAAVRRVLGWLSGDQAGLEPQASGAVPVVAFNLMTLAMIMGTPVMPDLSGHVVMVEEVSEYDYAVDRLLFHVTAGLAAMKAAGLRLGRVTQVPENERPFGMEHEAMARHWCARAGLPYLGRADIGHDADNRIVPFGLAGNPQGQ
ncbi:LD-carboxypeptidase [Novosphingobium pokkalii]|uniref:LD-carboxypeptidase n=1 Tax=Novosphingobium pokkalii TaxID=1770194 RepID=A0ABV7UZL0_9SPHN|nr:LD-carboxypeptidase [Novosphingobium pokkalii]GHC86834.1 peptidase S66 [Novosphingobium pokkalii]